jgi:transposase
MRRGQLAFLALSDAERCELEALTTRRKTAQALALRARIVLACAEGDRNKDVAARLGLDRATVGKWRRRFVVAAEAFNRCKDVVGAFQTSSLPPEHSLAQRCESTANLMLRTSDSGY